MYDRDDMGPAYVDEVVLAHSKWCMCYRQRSKDSDFFAIEACVEIRKLVAVFSVWLISLRYVT